MTSSDSAPRRRSAWLWWVGIVVGVVVLPVVFLLAVNHYRYQAELALIKAAGEPTNRAELEAYYARQGPSKEDDTTALWMEALALFLKRQRSLSDQEQLLLPVISGADVEIPPLGQAWPSIGVTENYLADLKEAFAKIEEAVARGGRPHWQIEFNVESPAFGDTLQNIRTITRHLFLAHRFALHRDQPDKAFARLKELSAHVTSCGEMPMAICALVGAGQNSTLTTEVFQYLEHPRVTDAELAYLQSHVEQRDMKRSMRAMWLGERAFFLEQCQNGFTRNSPDVMAAYFWRMPYLQGMRGVIEASERDWPSIIASAEKFREEGSILADYVPSPLENVARFTSNVAESEARHRLAILGIALRRFTLANGRVPESLDELVPGYLKSIPTDPYTGKPPRYRVHEGTVELTFPMRDGGFGLVQGGEGYCDDVTFSFRYPPVEPVK